MSSKQQTWLDTARKSAGWLIVFGVVEVVAGFLSIGSPFLAGLTVTVMVGVALLISGGARLAAAFFADSFGAGALTFLWGLIGAAAGFYLIIRPDIGLASLTVVVAMALFMDGVLRTVISFQVRPVSGWGWMLAGGLLSIAFALMIGWQFPTSSTWVIGTMVGISLLSAGFSTITLAGAARKATGTLEKAA